ncbi:sodium:proton antiporter [Halobacillus salinarum]|uniref:Sodium:proton antiporter n=1 Tax=Halobacillus salinarum TaxID=2932257 RepID=A0ABY4ELW0_9BACI|nr:sodium:proton antiporter [Halobacillus salinarum]UOQ44997.1 sodium:proton antiporter [Halobacillus salinarum]
MSASQVVLLLSIGYIIFTIDKKQKNLPVPVLLLLTGMILSFVPYFATIQVSETVIYDVFLPGLLFTSAYTYSPQALRKYAGIIGVLSTVGLISTALLLGLLMYVVAGWFFPISLAGAFLAASILTPTDPVSVVSILKQSSNDPSVADVVDGESMINDGTSVVLFGVLAGMYVNSQSFHIWSFFGEFLYVSIGGIVLGLGIGWLCSRAVHITHHKQYQVMLSIVTAYGIFHLAEHLGFSGVLATVTAGIMISWEFDHMNKEDHYREALAGFWDVVEPSLLSLVFLLIGIEATKYLTSISWILAIVIFMGSVVVRFMVVAASMQLFSGWREFIDWKRASLISWAGIRGTMSVFLLLSLHAQLLGKGDQLLSISFAVVVLSLVLQSIGIYPLARKMVK